MLYSIRLVAPDLQKSMFDFLKKREDYTLFLLNNATSDSPYSGDFYLIRRGEETVGVFSVSPQGNLLVDSLVHEPVYDLIIEACKTPFIRVLGDWEFCWPFWEYVKKKQILKETLVEKTILYAIVLADHLFPSQPNVRLLDNADFEQWLPLRRAYIKESGFPNELTDRELLTLFQKRVHEKIAWGLFLEEKLVAIADLNAKAFDIGQVGGVYTVPEFRGRGFCKSIMKQVLQDSKTLHALRKLIIFTGEENLAARRVYESLGVLPVGHYALLFGNSC